MNRTPTRDRRLTRVAAVTATAVGAALLTSVGPAPAQAATVDCDALGADPLAYNVADAVDAAVTCGVEVRIGNRSEPYSTLYATPTGQLHVVATAAPSGMTGDDGQADPTLMEWDGALTPTASPWSFWLHHSNPTPELFFTWGGALNWTGELPTPSYADATAVYDDLAAGVDLSVEVDVASAELRFTVDSAEAWNALATGLVLETDSEAVLKNGSLNMPFSAYGLPYEVQTSPIASLDAAGEFNAVGLELGEGNALTLSLPEGALDTASFPLTVTTQWAYSGYGIGEWGVVSSAAPDLAAYRGTGAGTEASFLEYSGANGDAGVGPHCDAFAAPDCSATADAASYWNFHSVLMTSSLRKPDYDYEWSFPIAEATFSIDLAADENGVFTCRTPDLVPVAEYSATVTWNHRPAAAGDAVPAHCEDEAVAYDVTEPVSTAWADETVSSEVAFGMTESAEAASFHGGSARLDVYFDVVGVIVNRLCQADPSHFRGGVDPLVYAAVWRPEATGLDLTWSATIRDADSGDTVLTTEPAAVESGGSVGAIVDGVLPDGDYTADYTIAATRLGVLETVGTCYFSIDTAYPKIAGVQVEPGPHLVGDTVGVTVGVTDEGFPDGTRELLVVLNNASGWAALDSAVLTQGGTAELEVTLTGPETEFYVQVEDEAVNETISSHTYTIYAGALNHDYNGDRLQDLMAVRKSDGSLMLYAGKGDGTFASGVAKGTGWGGLDVVMAGDLTGDGKADLTARDPKTGTLYTYPGDGTGGFGTRITVGTGWNAMGALTSGGDFNGDGKADLYAVGRSDGRLYFYPGQGNGKFGTARRSPPAGTPWTPSPRSATRTATGSPTSSPTTPVPASTTCTRAPALEVSAAASPSRRRSTVRARTATTRSSPSATRTGTARTTSSPSTPARASWNSTRSTGTAPPCTRAKSSRPLGAATASRPSTRSAPTTTTATASPMCSCGAPPMGSSTSTRATARPASPATPPGAPTSRISA
jgi:hypothetical protein